ncbi:MAG: hypothetical protein WHT47_03985 [Hydrogenothermaceae bacterium]
MDDKAFETAKQHAVIDVPVAHPDDTVEEILNKIFGKRYTSITIGLVLLVLVLYPYFYSGMTKK